LQTLKFAVSLWLRHEITALNIPDATSGRALRLRLRVTAAAESIIRAGHPWLFADSIREQNRAGFSGELAAIYDRKDCFLAVGLFDPDSPIRVRILHAGKPQTIDGEWWQARLEEALTKREGLFDACTTGYRCINGENDGWPGLVLDRYGETLVLKLYTGVWLPRLKEILDVLRGAQADENPKTRPERILLPRRIVLRLSRNIQNIAQTKFNLLDGQVIQGDNSIEPASFLETGLHFEADVAHGQKTGFFLDQRENRRQVEKLARGRSVLNAFSFSGGFSLYAARGSARSATDLDISAYALAGARRHFKLNQKDPAVAQCCHELVQADTFEWLKDNSARKFELVVLDPPSLAKRESERAGAIRAYGRLAELGLRVLSRGGILLAASCSAHVTVEEFFGVVRQTAVKSGRKFSELQTTGHAPDHPAKFKEAEYLKAIYLKLH
jgi:23S rRNA (cytosine1962-C5)-methyltransferase